jgi:hypothetical protein
VKKEDREITLLNSDVVSNKYQKNDNYKTTNINILLNRVRLDKKKNFQKKNFDFISFVLVTTCAIVYFYIS